MKQDDTQKDWKIQGSYHNYVATQGPHIPDTLTLPY